MTGIYLHIPFCIQRCHYCDFFSSTSLELKDEFVLACLKEIDLRADYLEEKKSDTIYLGGGTPSLLDIASLELILSKLRSKLKITSDAEITMEANPDDLNPDLLKDLRSIGFNRISIGIQSFIDSDLKLMNRRHSAEQAVESVFMAHAAGFDNISIDLIYGIPNLSDHDWINNLKKIKDLPIKHLSAYHLTIEPETRFGKWKREGRLVEMGEESSLKQFQSLTRLSREYGFEQYEISNFAKNKQYSRHNIKYWNGEWYLGIGPSAHSYNGYARHWNPSDLQKYLRGYKEGNVLADEEVISKTDRRNELIMTRLRTVWGVDKSDWEKIDSPQSWTDFILQCQKYFDSNDILKQDDKVIINPDSWFRLDGIIADLFYVSES